MKKKTKQKSITPTFDKIFKKKDPRLVLAFQVSALLLAFKILKKAHNWTKPVNKMKKALSSNKAIPRPIGR